MAMTALLVMLGTLNVGRSSIVAGPSTVTMSAGENIALSVTTTPGLGANYSVRWYISPYHIWQIFRRRVFCFVVAMAVSACCNSFRMHSVVITPHPTFTPTKLASLCTLPTPTALSLPFPSLPLPFPSTSLHYIVFQRSRFVRLRSTAPAG